MIKQWAARIRTPYILAIIGRLIVGAGLDWWVNRPPPPWLQFHDVQARQTSADQVAVAVSYTINDLCESVLVWRTEVLTANGRVYSFARDPALEPHGPVPQLGDQVNRLSYSLTVPQGEVVNGWAIRIIVTCPDAEQDTVVSRPAVIAKVSLQFDG